MMSHLAMSFLPAAWRSRSPAQRAGVLAVAALLVSCGCSQRAGVVLPSAARSGSVRPLDGSVRPLDGSVQAVQGTAEYRQAVRSFARRDYRQALALVDLLLKNPQFREVSAGSGFLRSQQAICRHALGPHAWNAQARPGSSPASGPSSAVPVARAVPPRPAAPADCGPRALLLACQTLGRPATLEELRRQAGTPPSGTSFQGLAQAAKAHGLKARGIQVDLAALEQLSPPALVWVDGNHYVALLSVEGRRATIHDPNQPEEEVLPVTRLLQRSSGVLLTLAR